MATRLALIAMLCAAIVPQAIFAAVESTSTSLVSSGNPSAYRQAVTLTATVTAASGTPAGNVKFLNGTASLGMVELSNGAATLVTTALAVGTRSLTAEYTGNKQFSASTSAVVTEDITQAATSVTLSSSANPAVFEQPVTLTAVVQSSAGAPAGRVTFRNGTASVGSVTLVGGMGSLTTAFASLGAKSVTAEFDGSADYAVSTSAPLAEVINRATSTIALTAVPDPSTVGQAVTLTATVAPEYGGTPKGAVAFGTTSTNLGVATVSGNVATLVTSALPAGSIGVTSTFFPAADYAESTASISQTVNPANPPATSYSLIASALNPGASTPGSTSTSIISLTASNNYSGNVQLSCSVAGATTPAPSCSFNPAAVTLAAGATGISAMTLSTAQATAAGAYSLSISGRDDNGAAPSNGASSLTVSVLSAIQHVVIIFQENRTPDNLFQDPVLIARGADIAQSGVNSLGQTIQLTGIDLGTAGSNPQYYDLSHAHSAFVAQWDGGKMDGADLVPCQITPPETCPPNEQFRYVYPSDVGPYFAMAEQYTFADRMFQTNQGPSYPAHQFILAGTSAPTASSPLFASEDPPEGSIGCTAPAGTTVTMIDAAGSESAPAPEYPCFEHSTLSDLLNEQGISWRYYSWNTGTVWNPPNSIAHICQAEKINGAAKCTGPEWVSNVVAPETTVLSDIASGQLAQVTWVTPNGLDSDHPGGNDGTGPSWVASVVNAIGNSPYWANTAILVTWDDWGGWFDHVGTQVISDGVSWGSGYVYGLRVPLIVISPYAKSGYISHVTHDFGSILKFVETTFNLPSLGYADAPADDLADCFDLTQQPIQFTTIAAPHDAAYFINDKRPRLPPDND